MPKEKNEFEFDNEENQFDKEENTAPDSGEKTVIELPHVVTLEDPFTLGKKQYTELTFQNKLEIGMLQHFNLGAKGAQKIGHFIGPISKMTGEPTAVIHRLSWRDFDACMSIFLYFF